MNNPMGLFVRMILAKLSLIVFLPALLVTYWVFSGLQSAGVLDAAFRTIGRGLLETKAVAQNCTPKILNFSALWACLESPGRYTEHPIEARLRQRMRALHLPDDIDYDDYVAPDVRNPYLSEIFDE